MQTQVCLSLLNSYMNGVISIIVTNSLKFYKLRFVLATAQIIHTLGICLPIHSRKLTMSYIFKNTCRTNLKQCRPSFLNKQMVNEQNQAFQKYKVTDKTRTFSHLIIVKTKDKQFYSRTHTHAERHQRTQYDNDTRIALILIIINRSTHQQTLDNQKKTQKHMTI